MPKPLNFSFSRYENWSRTSHFKKKSASDTDADCPGAHFDKFLCLTCSGFKKLKAPDQISSQFSRSVVSDSLRPHELQHARPPCPSPSPRVHTDSCPLSPWCHPVISSLVVPFSFCPQFLPTSETFPMSQLFAWGGQSTGASALASFLPKNPRADLL